MGILAEQENGQIIHGRNLDYDFPSMLQNVLYLAKFYRNDSVRLERITIFLKIV